MPPNVARVDVLGSGPKRRPVGARARCSVSMTTPGSTVAVRASVSIETMRVRCRLVSMTRPGPIALPATDVPPPRMVTGSSKFARGVEGGREVRLIAGVRHGLRNHAVIGGVGAVLGAASGARIYVAVDVLTQRGRDVLALPWLRSRSRRHCSTGPGQGLERREPRRRWDPRLRHRGAHFYPQAGDSLSVLFTQMVTPGKYRKNGHPATDTPRLCHFLWSHLSHPYTSVTWSIAPLSTSLTATFGGNWMALSRGDRCARTARCGLCV